MGFEGDVKDFGLSEIFQLIAVQQKSGMLLVTGEEKITVFFREGMIISTRDRRDNVRDPLKDFLLKYGFISREEMSNLLQIQQETKMDLTDILISEKYFSEDELSIIFTDQIYESIQEVLKWPKSHYKFISGKSVIKGVNSFSNLKVDAVLMESMRRIDEFPELMRIFPSVGMKFKRVQKDVDEISGLSGNEEFLYELLEREMTLTALISAGKMPLFSVYEAMKELLDRELLQVIETPEPEEATKTVKPDIKQDKKKVIMPHFATAAILLACFFIGEFAVPMILQRGWSLTGFHRSGHHRAKESRSLMADDIDELKARQLEKKIRSALKEYFAEKGAYPLTLEILAVRGYVENEVLRRAEKAGIDYRLDNDTHGYIMTRA